MPNRGPDQPPRLEQIERQHLGGERRRHVEAAAIFVEIDEGERAVVGKARAVEREQQVAILRMGVVVPAEAVVAERYRRDRLRPHGEDDNGKPVGSRSTADRVPRRGERDKVEVGGDVYLLAATNISSTWSQFTR